MRILMLLMALSCLCMKAHAQVDSPTGTVGTGSASTDMVLKTGPAASGTARVTIQSSNGYLNVASGVLSTSGTTALSFRTGGTSERMVINSSGNVGVGITPTQKFHVSGNIFGDQLWSSTGVFNSQGSSPAVLATNGTARLTANTNGTISVPGSLAVGGTTPAQPLDVTGNAQVSGGFIMTGTTPFIYTGTGSTEAGRYIQIANTTQLATPAGLKAGGVLISDDFAFAAPAKNDLVVKGKIAIGSAAATQPLDVTGNAQINGGLILPAATPSIYTSTGSTEAGKFVRITNSTQTQTPAGLRAGGVVISDDFGYGNPSKNDLVVKGKVAIGTATLTSTNNYTLAVNGKIGTKDIQVEGNSNAWPDYVFAPEYKLPSLSEVAAFINANKHLPEVPSAEQVAKEGYSVSEMDAALLKKVEQLTLYVIEQQKQIDELKKALEEKK